MTVNPQITALLPTYKRPEYLRRAITSVLRQTYRDLQICVFDDASGDHTENVVSELQQNDLRIKYHCHSKNLGLIANYRYAFQSINTPYFSVLSDDDFLSENFYEKAIQVLDENPDIMFVVTNTIYIDENRELANHTKSDNSLKLFRDNMRFDAFHAGEIPYDWTAMVFRKEVANVYLDMDDRYDIAYDMRYILRAMARYHFAYLSIPGAFFTAHKKSISAARKNLDYAHVVVMMSRYVEIINDDKVDVYIKKRALFYMKKIMATDYYRSEVVRLLKAIIKNSCDRTDYTDSVVKRDIESLSFEGYTVTSKIFKHIYKSDLIGNIIKLVFGSYNSRNADKYRTDFTSLQNGEYRDLFKYINEISASCGEIVDIDEKQKTKLRDNVV
ncbi:glycosyltransferase family 2 protein [Chlorobium ferrooxidans]|uniref:Glycosyl transferase, family 2 n=1 Tax=Chlorobium ferrooxidans DSM 13031 TaxID=377431 RepID=Q0YTT7_9CHLB|nr:glycosyltransferase family 2 protein [Chlorobium ferrooxidans]EAT59814.1 Glycosyl transferase, family 2 [Chlorobium ferrooxidans DSM 13031]